jgi:glutathione synthase/RimK-type ligase-like ATP-grasp enzyme
MKTPCIALVTAAAARDHDEDLAPLARALRDIGADVAIPDWDDRAMDWSRFDLALLRSPWDYSERLPEFLAWAERAAAQTCIMNPLDVLRWNTDKHYLGELALAGVPVVPSHFIEPGADVEASLDAFSTGSGDGFAEFVVKPCVGAGSRDAQRYCGDDRSAAEIHIRRLLDAGRSVLLQPYLARVDEQGETALICFDGRFSHAIRKGPLLRRGEGPTRALFAPEAITPREPSAAERATAERALAAIGFGKPLLYARVDLIHDDRGEPCLLELELAEPSLFFAHAEGSAERFADAIMARAGSIDEQGWSQRDHTT